MLPVFPAVTVMCALTGFVAGVIFAKPVFLELIAVKRHVSDEVDKARAEVAQLRADLKAFVEHLGQKV